MLDQLMLAIVDVETILDGCVFVAHTVRFDYGLLRSEFARLEPLADPAALAA